MNLSDGLVIGTGACCETEVNGPKSQPRSQRRHLNLSTVGKKMMPRFGVSFPEGHFKLMEYDATGAQLSRPYREIVGKWYTQSFGESKDANGLHFDKYLLP